ncbi:MAG TPA: cyclic pyranopterin monophosphate synthase MoaC [Bacteroidales bacterium]|jgi:cyclic pyranopterin phosphate synthase|nr:cyclic pyranopterin monophosphate synthase MoaC [Bacteroidales bacterium]
MEKLTHIDEKGKAEMVDVGPKEIQERIVKASGHIRLGAETLRLINDNLLEKGDVLTVAKIAGIIGAKQTSSIIPLTHNIFIEWVNVDLYPDETGIVAESEVRCTGKTGAEMEALTSVSMALLTVYDMCKAVDKLMVIDKIMVTEKTKK